MTRKKVKLAWIVNDSARKASLKKRRIGLLKKVRELTTLCGVSAFVIVYSPDDSEPAVWPSRPVVQQLLDRFLALPEVERCKKMMNQDSYLKERMGKLSDQTRKHHKKSREMEMTHLMHQVYQENGLDNFETSELYGLTWLVDEKMKEIRKRFEYFEQFRAFPAVSFLPGAGGEDTDNNNNNLSSGAAANPAMLDQWFMDMMNNSGNNMVGSSSTKNDVAGMLPHPYGNISGSSGGIGLDMMLHHPNIGGGSVGSNFVLGLSHGVGGTGGTNFELGLPLGNSGNPGVDLGLGYENIACASLGMGLPYGHIGGINAFHGIGLSHGNIAGSSSASGGNLFHGLGFPSHGNPGGGSDNMELPTFFAGAGTDMGLPFDVTKAWPNNNDATKDWPN